MKYIRYIYIQSLKTQHNRGFTLIELLVVLVIVGLLSTIAFPSFLGQVGKARETEAKNGVGTINRAQQAFHFERQVFSPNLTQVDLGVQNTLGVIVASSYYQFDILAANSATDATVTADPNGTPFGGGTAVALDNATKTYSGAINHTAGLYTTITCQEDAIPTTPVAPAAPAAGATACPAGYTSL